MKKTVRDIDVKGKRVLVRCDFNVPMQDGKITDDTRIVSALPTIRYLTEHGAKVILMSHMGRPKGEPKKEFTLQPVADRLTQLLGKQVFFAASDRVVDEKTRQAAAALAEGDIEAQTKQVFENLKAVLEAAGSGLDKIVKTTCFMDNMNDFAKMNEVYASFFSGDYPSRSAVEVAKLPKGALIEIEAIAYL